MNVTVPSPLRPLPLLFVVAALAPAVSRAQAPDAAGAPGAEPSRFALGVGVASRQFAYAGRERKNQALPILLYENSWVRVAGLGAEFKLWRQPLGTGQALTGGLRIKYDNEGFEADDSPRLAGMAERKGGFWGGAAVSWRNPVAPLTLEWLADLSGHSKGSKLQLQAERRFGWGPLGLTPRVQLQWLDRKYVDYYFGVRASEATADRAAYDGASALAVEAGLRMDYALAFRHAVFLDLSRTQLPDEIKLSPIVDRKATSRVMAGYLYRF
ncbi:MipA/OmpV family protein [Roseateles sp. BYS96W]|uniref:MipA/OmpV family protein n=1 Tax=Pelomonas nitida TaxID=3299027 RepID=A0ABW7GBH5_9BURK